MTKKLSTPYLQSRRATLRMLGAAGIGAFAEGKELWITRAAAEHPVATAALPASVQDAVCCARACAPPASLVFYEDRCCGARVCRIARCGP